MIRPPPALSVNGPFTETERIMAWVGAGGERDGGHTQLFLIWLVMKRISTCSTRSKARLHAVNEDVASCPHRQVCKSNSWTQASALCKS